MRIEQRGDSITYFAQQMLKEYLPADATVINLGVGGQRAREITIPTFRTDTIYTFSFGTNECLSAVPVAEFRQTIANILELGKGYKIALEAPWLVTHPSCAPVVNQYRAAIVSLGQQYGVPVSIENTTDHDGGGVHLTQAHMQLRARLLADAILRL